MAKRYVNDEKFQNVFYRSLPGAYKLLWDYICCNCSTAGLWTVDFPIAQLYLGNDMLVNKDDALQFFNAGQIRIIELERGQIWFIQSYIKFQYPGGVTATNRATRNVKIKLKEYGIEI